MHSDHHSYPVGNTNVLLCVPCTTKMIYYNPAVHDVVNQRRGFRKQSFSPGRKKKAL